MSLDQLPFDFSCLFRYVVRIPRAHLSWSARSAPHMLSLDNSSSQMPLLRSLDNSGRLEFFDPICSRLTNDAAAAPKAAGGSNSV